MSIAVCPLEQEIQANGTSTFHIIILVYDKQPDYSPVTEDLSLLPLSNENIMACRRINTIGSHYRWDRPLGFNHLSLYRCSVTIALWAVHQKCSLLGMFGSSHVTLCTIPLMLIPSCLRMGISCECRRVHLFLRQELLAIEMTIGTIRTNLGNIEKSPSDLQT